MIIMKSNKPTKTKKAMKTIKFLSMAALALVGAVMTGCSSDDEIIETPQQPVNSQNVETLTTTVGFDEVAVTRALTSGGVKTFAAGDKLALVYKNTSGQTVKAESAALPSGSYSKSATFTFELVNADKTKNVTYIYPASMANNDGTIDYDALATQNGTLGTLESSLDLATFSDDWNDTSLPAGTLVNQLAVCALTLKDNAGSSTITSGLTEVTVSDGSNTYTVAPTSGTFGEDVIYVAIRPVEAALEYTATDGTKNYTKTATSREYEAGSFYNLGLRMYRMAAAATNADKGKLICTDGHIHAYGADAACTKARVAKIIYIGTTGHATYSHGLALAMENVSENTLSWNNSGTNNDGKTAAEWCSAWNTSKPVKDAEWLLASKDQWTSMINAAGSDYALRTGFTSVGVSIMQSDHYWSCTEHSSPGWAWYYDFLNGKWDFSANNRSIRVRACLAF